MKNDIPIVVFSDLDGTLLDLRTYAADGARSALARLAREGIPLVFCSSKTRAEIQLVQQELGVSHPFICENGGALYMPDGYFVFEELDVRKVAGYCVVEFGRPYAEVVERLHQAAARLRLEVVGFSDMSVEEVARECDLPLMQARLAKLREFDEPFRIVGAQPGALAQLSRALKSARLNRIGGARFEHACGAVDKGTAVGLIAALYERAFGSCLTIGLGDALNDVCFLRKMDVPVIVRNGDGGTASLVLEQVPAATVTRSAGPEGWSQAVVEILDDIRSGRPLPVYSQL
jgi:mannosyl-3-phosphoglycerate phosphatase